MNTINNDLIAYFEGMKRTMWALFYRVVGEQLSHITNSKILDFGSELGITADHLAKNNNVVAIEPNANMAEMRIHENSVDKAISLLHVGTTNVMIFGQVKYI